MIGAGDLRHLVGFYQREDLSDTSPQPDYGVTEGEFLQVFTAQAQIRPKLGGEDVLAARLTGKNLVNITVRKSAASAAVTTDWMAKNERSGESYNIRSIIDPFQSKPQRGRFIELLCEKGVAI